MPADGWYEWTKSGGKKLPWYFRRDDGKPIVFAGLRAKGEDDNQTMAIITEPARGMAKTIHNRMPLVLTRDSISSWLAPGLVEPEEIREQVHHEPIEQFEAYRVTPAVIRADAVGAGLIAPLATNESDQARRST